MYVLTSIASIAKALYIIKLLYNSTVPMVVDAICYYYTLWCLANAQFKCWPFYWHLTMVE